MKKNPNGFIVRLIDGPLAGREVRFKSGVPDPADEIVASTTQYVAEGITYCFDLGSRDLLPGDCIYEVRNRSQLPPDFGHPGIIRGAEYVFVREVQEDE